MSVFVLLFYKYLDPSTIAISVLYKKYTNTKFITSINIKFSNTEALALHFKSDKNTKSA